MIRFENVSKTYPGGHRALEKVSFELADGELAFLTGHSGAGKSTLLKLLFANTLISLNSRKVYVLNATKI